MARKKSETIIQNEPLAGQFPSLILPGNMRDEKFVEDAVRAATPMTRKEEAIIRVKRRAAEEIPLDADDDAIIKLDKIKELSQPFVPYATGDMVIANTAKPAHELSEVSAVRPYEIPDNETPEQTAARIRFEMGSVLFCEDGKRIHISSEFSKNRANNQAPIIQGTTTPEPWPARMNPSEPRSATAVRKKTDIVFKYDEDVSLYDLIDYIGATYSGHYAKDGGLQTLDVWDALGSSVETCRDTAIKYLMRFGEKQGRNQKDLQKAIHYITLMMYFDTKRG